MPASWRIPSGNPCTTSTFFARTTNRGWKSPFTWSQQEVFMNSLRPPRIAQQTVGSWRRSRLGACGVLACAWALLALLSAPAARADSVLLSSGTAMTGKQSWSSDLSIETPGTLSVRVTDLGEPFTIVEPLASLSFGITSATGPLDSRSGEGELSMDIAPGLYSLYIAAVPGGRFNLGLVSWTATLQTLAAPVPLPASLWLLIASLAWA